MFNKKKSLTFVLTTSLLVTGSSAFAFINRNFQKLESATKDFTLTLNNSNGGLTNSDYSSTAAYSSAYTNYGNEIQLKYLYAKQTTIDEDGYGYDENTGFCSLQRYSAHSGTDAYIYNYDVITNMKTITFTFVSGGSYGLSLYFSYNSTTFSSSTKVDYGDEAGSYTTTNDGSEHTYTVDASGYNRFYIEAYSGGLSSIYIKNIIITYTCTDAYPDEEEDENTINLNSSTPLWSSSSISDSERTVIDDIPYFHGGCYPSSGLNKLYGQGYIYNQYPIYGIEKINITYSGSGNLRIIFGYAIGNYDLYSVDTITSGNDISFDDTTGYPNFFYLENTSGSKSYVTSDNTGSYSVTTTGGTTTYSSSSVTLYHFEQSFDSTSYVDISNITITYKGTNQASASDCLHKYIEIKASGLNVRSGPGTSGTTVIASMEGGTLSNGNYKEHLAYRETVYDGDGDPWYRTYYMNQDCYVSGNSSYTSIKQLADFGSDAENSIVVEAEKRIGDRYLLGAQRYCWSATGSKDSSFDECYYDCSSLVIRAFRDGAGLYPGAATSTQINYGNQVSSSSNLSLGNLAMFTSGDTDTSRSNVGHVTLWLGVDSDNTSSSELMIQASGSNFTGTVKMYPNWSTYWCNYFIEGRSID